jgi:hypothetical protein
MFTTQIPRPLVRSNSRAHVATRGISLPHVIDPGFSGESESQIMPLLSPSTAKRSLW